MQDTLFPDLEPDEPAAEDKGALQQVPPAGPKASKVRAQPPDPAHEALAAALPRTLYLGTSSWTYPGWSGLVWDDGYSEQALSKQGLAAYAQHPLLRAVSIDRSFYRALTVSQYARYAEQVPEGFRFVVKAPSMVADALVRDEDGRGMKVNPLFLDAQLAVQDFVQPALEGLGSKLGALVFQLSPLPPALLNNLPEVLRRLKLMLQALPTLRPTAPDGVVAVEVRDAAFIVPALADLLRATGATYCLGLHPKLPPLAEQLPLLRALWPGPLVCRWNMNELHGPFGYEQAQKLYDPYDKLMDPDLPTREALARVITGTTRARQNAFVTVSNHAEGCAPLSVAALAQAVQACASGVRAPAP